ncbi:DNA excision repair protein ERCC-2 [Nematocida sp. AWRm80]|nr:DNA excision repair protein ERCC-2 [Nematocida sp. AWRm80]
MIIKICGIEVIFPLEKIYPEQLQYIKELYEVVQGKGHCLIEMPTGTGKTIAILSFLVSYQIHLSSGGIGLVAIKESKKVFRLENQFKIVYCTRTTAELDKVLEELKVLYKAIQEYIPKIVYTGIGLAARRTLCTNETVNASGVPSEINRRCRQEKLKCEYFNNYVDDQTLPPGIYSLDDLKTELATGTKPRCPYYTARSILALADCVVYTYNYIIDPRINELITEGFGSNCIVVFDEAHNIDNACIECLTIKVSRNTLDSAWKSICYIEEISKTLSLQNSVQHSRKDGISIDLASILMKYSTKRRYTTLVPGSIRNTKGFISAMKRIIEFFKTKLKEPHLVTESTETFVKELESSVFVEYSSLIHLSLRLRTLLGEIERNNISEDFTDLSKLCDFCSLAGQFKKGFSVIFEPYNNLSIYEPILGLYCLDSSIAMKKIFSTYKNVIITSGTLSPISIYPRLLDFIPVKSIEIDIAARKCLCSLIVTKGSDQMTLATSGSDTNTISSTFSLRTEPSVVRNYGNLVLEMSSTVPDGLVCFFPSYRYMEEAVSAWSESGIIKKILNNKLIFAESIDHTETEIALEGYRKACDIGRGAILLGVARGKVSEGVDFSGAYGRGVLVLGVPFQYTESPRLKKRLEFLADEFGIREAEFLSFDAMRQAAQCVGRVLRSNTDYGLAVLADRRFNLQEKREQLPRWIQRNIDDYKTNLSIDMSISLARQFFRTISSTEFYH